MNRLFPIFVKFEQLNILLVGGGNIGLEKLTAIVKNCPDPKLTIVGEQIRDEIREIAKDLPSVEIRERKFEPADLEGLDLVFLATNNRPLNEQIRAQTRSMGILINVADTPDLCDFYLSSVVQKGDLKIAISTNGKSPTVAKRIKEFLNDIIPEDIDLVLSRMNRIRDNIKGNFQDKVNTLNQITANWLDKNNS